MGRSNHEDPNLLICMGNLDPGHLPRPSQADQPGVVIGDRVIRHPAKLSPISSPLPHAIIRPLTPISAPSVTHSKPGRAKNENSEISVISESSNHTLNLEIGE
jgi:hypothetical protein